MMWTIGSIFLLAAAGSVAISAHVGWRLTHPAHKPVDDSPAAYGLAYQDIAFESRTKDANLRGWFLPASGPDARMTIILAHGYAGNRLEKSLPALALARSLVEAGYHVLMFDFRNSGLSEGSMTTVGFLEKQDLLGAIDWAKRHVPGVIGLIGFSMGGSASILAAAEEESVAGVVADSPFSQLRPYLRTNLPVWSKLPHFPFTPLILTILPRMTGIDPERVDALAAVDRVGPRPILFIHSRNDGAIPYTYSEAMWSRNRHTSQLWLTEKAGHVGSYKLYPSEYTNRVLAFFANL